MSARSNARHDSLESLRTKLNAFTEARDWEKFHTPKNLAIALSVEVSEFLELFQWLTDKEAEKLTNRGKEMRRAREELADIFIYLIRLGDVLGVDLIEAASAKIATNERKYPVEISKGNSTKYDRRPR